MKARLILRYNAAILGLHLLLVGLGSFQPFAMLFEATVPAMAAMGFQIWLDTRVV